MGKGRANSKKRFGTVATGAISRRYSGKTGVWAKRDTSTGRFVDIKKSGGDFKGVERER